MSGSLLCNPSSLLRACRPIAQPRWPGALVLRPSPLAQAQVPFLKTCTIPFGKRSTLWNWKNGWFTSLGFALQGPDGSQYNGTLNQDYWTFSPTAAVSYIDKNWKNSINFEYDIHTASKGHTGSYAAVAFNVPGAPAFVAPNGCVGFQCAGSGYTTGDQLFIDWNVLYRYGKLEFGPVGYLKFQTTADFPGSGYTCATLAATYGQSLGCGRAEDIALGGEIGYDFGPAELEVWATDSVYTKDDFSGASVFTRLSFKLEDPSPKPAATAPMVSKSH